MLESIREGVKKPWVKIVIFIIVISFVFAGYFSSSFFLGDPNAVAIVNGNSISRIDFQRAYNNTKSQRQDYYNATVKTDEDERKFQEDVLQRLIDEEVRKQAIVDLEMRLSTDALRQLIQTDPNYVVDGQYSPGLVEQTIIRAQMSKSKFKSIYAQQGVTQQLVAGLMDSEFALQGEAKADFEIMTEARSGKALQVNSAAFVDKIELSDEAIQAYYQENLEAFRVEEKVSVEYIEISLDKLKAAQQVTDEEVTAFYENNIEKYKTEEQKRVSHILVLANDDESAALEKIQEIKAKIDAGESFAELAKQFSDDVPTKESGGDLGFLLEGAMEASFEAAAQALQNIGDVSEPVKSDFGYQLIQLTEVKDGSAIPLAEVKDEIKVAIQTTKAEEDYYAKSTQLAKLAFEIADSLTEAASATGLEVKTSPLFGQSYNQGLFANQQLKNAAFSSDVIEAQLNSELVEIADKHAVVLRVKEHVPSRVQAISEVKARVEQNLKQTQAKQKAQQVANSILEQLKQGQAANQIMAEHNLAWQDLNKLQRNNAQLPFLANAEFFKMTKPNEGEVVYNIVEGIQGATLLMLNQVEKGDYSTAEEAEINQRMLFLNSYYSNAEISAFIEEKRLKSEVTRNLNNLVQ
ncbi:SurA N-terminal domain-containing protein [Aliikangiella sp. IMCC44632]